jgi:hypothetical protein
VRRSGHPGGIDGIFLATIDAGCAGRSRVIVSTRIFKEPAGFVESRSWNEKKRVPDRSVVGCTGMWVGGSIPHS